MKCANDNRVALVRGPGRGELGAPSSKKLFVGGQLKGGSYNRTSPCECLDFRAEVFKLGGVKSLQGGREHSSDVMLNVYFQIFSNYIEQKIQR